MLHTVKCVFYKAVVAFRKKSLLEYKGFVTLFNIFGYCTGGKGDLDIDFLCYA